jgi:anti-sigma regulatory factor (Ser/Thr protein kinase)
LPHDLSSARLARRHVEQFAAEQHLNGTTHVLTIITSELVSNAVLHGAAPVAMSLCHEFDEITVEVSDGDAAVNAVRSPAPHERSIGGHGLLIVASLADRWGIRPARTGKTVWATVQHRAHA